MSDERFFGYSRVLAGHEECGTARWVWMASGERVHDGEWMCPVCGKLMGMADRGATRTVVVPEGCVFFPGEVAR